MLLGEALNQYVQDHPEKMPDAAPPDFQSTLKAARRAAEGIMLCQNESEAITLLQQDLESALCAVWLTTEVSPDDQMRAVKHAHAEVQYEPTILPFHSAASWMIELCDNLELKPNSPEE